MTDSSFSSNVDLEVIRRERRRQKVLNHSEDRLKRILSGPDGSSLCFVKFLMNFYLILMLILYSLIYPNVNIKNSFSDKSAEKALYHLSF